MAECCEISPGALSQEQRHRARWPLLIAPLWIIAVLGGLWLLWRYASTPAIPTRSPEHWPASTSLQLSSRGKTLVMFVHPHCPCTRASLAQLERIISQCEGTVTPWIVVYKPSQMKEGWEHSDLWDTAASVPGAHVVSDPDGAEGIRFQAATSGQTLLYNSDGKLLFNGGITGARGHEGDNDGQDAVVELLRHGSASCRESPVFGCPILHRSDSN